ncbi:MAG: ABC transporter ATP-binding protein [Caldilineaceae bacterium]|nr:ABC transporter ATP-binding protein [Caldilineaceae bacterium]
MASVSDTGRGDLLLEVRNLQVHFYLFEGVVQAVNDVSFDVHRGRTLGIIGESGSGKSVSAQSVMGIVPSPPAKQLAGEIVLHRATPDGGTETLDLGRMDPRGPEYRDVRGGEIGMIFQEPMTSFSPLHSIGDQIGEAILLHIPDSTPQTARERTEDLLRRVGIPRPDRAVDAFPHQLSGGMRQRAMIAMALSCDPALLIADEPTTALDVTIEAQILELIQELQQDLNMAIIYISHDLAVVGGVADEVMVMYLGLVMEHADAETIFDDPLHPYTRALWQSIPKIDGPLEELVPISGNIPNPFAVHRGCPFYARCTERIQGVCDESPPPVLEPRPGHTVRCFLYVDDVGSDANGAMGD